MTATGWRLSLRGRILILTAVALAPALIILVLNEVLLRRGREAEVHALALRYGQFASLELQSIISGIEGQLRVVARAPVVRSFDAEACSAYLSDIRAQTRQLKAITVIDAAGQVRCRTNLPEPGDRLDERPYFREALNSGGFVIGEYTVSRIQGEKALPLALAIKDREGPILGVVAADLDLDWLGERIRDRDLAQGNALTIADRNGVIIAREPFPEQFIGTRIPDPFQPLVRAGAPGTQEVLSQDGTRRIIGYFPATATPTGLYISAGISRDEAFKAINQSTRQGIALALGGSLVAFGAAWLLADKFVRKPVAKLVTTIEAWHDEDSTARTGMSASAGELESVGEAIDGFMEELHVRQAARMRAEAHQRLLLSELNHRVRNSLATVQFIAAQTLRGSTSFEEAIEALNARLVALARAHDLLTQENWDGADMHDLVRRAIEPFSGSGTNRIWFEGPSLRVSSRVALALSMAFQELATNAVKYGALSNATGNVRVTWRIHEGVEATSTLHVRWEEVGGPQVEPPTRSGFGSKLLERALAHDLDGAVKLDFLRTGIVCAIEAIVAS